MLAPLTRVVRYLLLLLTVKKVTIRSSIDIQTMKIDMQIVALF